MILFLSKYPETQQELQDGFYQRVVHIDSLFQTKERSYLDIRLFDYWRIIKKDDREGRVTIQCNLLVHLFIILRTFKKSELVYIQSIYNLLYTFPFFRIFKRKYVLDLHGVVPDELALLQQNFKSKLFQFVEKFVYSQIDTVIGVSNRLIQYYKDKYPTQQTTYLVYPILPNNLENIPNELLKIALNSDTVNFIYSGNLQQWQNIDLMIEHIKKVNDVPNYFFQILTGDPDNMLRKIIDKGIDTKNIDVRAVQPSELSEYYKKAHYGFILRDDIIINNVACPTKLIEYMNYGIIPVVQSDRIGDFSEMNYERLSIKDLTRFLPLKKSEKNIQIIKTIYNNNLVNRVLIENMAE